MDAQAPEMRNSEMIIDPELRDGAADEVPRDDGAAVNNLRGKQENIKDEIARLIMQRQMLSQQKKDVSKP
jgi:hypothetical protein